MIERLLTAKEATEILGISTKTLYIYIGRGDLKASRLGNGWRIQEKDLQAFIDRGAGNTPPGRKRKAQKTKTVKAATNA